MSFSKISAKGWVVIPAELRLRYGLKPGMRVQVVDYGGVVSLIPLLKGTASPEQKRAWIFSERGNKRTIRNERFKLDSDGRFWDLKNDPLEQNDLSQSTVPEIVLARASLHEVLRSLPADAPPPFLGFLQLPKRTNKE